MSEELVNEQKKASEAINEKKKIQAEVKRLNKQIEIVGLQYQQNVNEVECEMENLKIQLQ